MVQTLSQKTDKIRKATKAYIPCSYTNWRELRKQGKFHGVSVLGNSGETQRNNRCQFWRLLLFVLQGKRAATSFVPALAEAPNLSSLQLCAYLPLLV